MIDPNQVEAANLARLKTLLANTDFQCHRITGVNCYSPFVCTYWDKEWEDGGHIMEAKGSTLAELADNMSKSDVEISEVDHTRLRRYEGAI